MKEYIYCAVDKNGNIQDVKGSSQTTRYYKTDRYLKQFLAWHNKYYTNDLWHIQKFVLVEVEE